MKTDGGSEKTNKATSSTAFDKKGRQMESWTDKVSALRLVDKRIKTKSSRLQEEKMSYDASLLRKRLTMICI